MSSSSCSATGSRSGTGFTVTGNDALNEGGSMKRKGLTRRKFLASAAGIGSFAIIGRPRAATPYTPSDSLLEAARKEGKFTLYTATFTEVEQEVINEFRKK